MDGATPLPVQLVLLTAPPKPSYDQATPSMTQTRIDNGTTAPCMNRVWRTLSFIDQRNMLLKPKSLDTSFIFKSIYAYVYTHTPPHHYRLPSSLLLPTRNPGTRNSLIRRRRRRWHLHLVPVFGAKARSRCTIRSGSACVTR